MNAASMQLVRSTNFSHFTELTAIRFVKERAIISVMSTPCAAIAKPLIAKGGSSSEFNR